MISRQIQSNLPHAFARFWADVSGGMRIAVLPGTGILHQAENAGRSGVSQSFIEAFLRKFKRSIFQ